MPSNARHGTHGPDGPFGAGHAGARLMLRAMFLHGDARDTALVEWFRSLEGRALGPDEEQIGATMYRALVRRGVAHSILAPLARLSDAAWVLHQVRSRTLREVLTLLHARNIETLVLKGEALVATFYRDAAARRVGDADILVAESRYREGVRVLVDAGWTPLSNPRFFHPRFQHALDFQNERGDRVDLHCHALHVSCEPGADDAFWAASVPMTIGGVRTRTLCTTDHLFHVLVHGQMSLTFAPIRWYADAATILHAAGETIDWDRMVALARARRVTGLLLQALQDLSAVLDSSGPPLVSRALAESPRQLPERWMVRGARPKAGHPLRNVQYHWGRFFRGTRGLSTVARLRLIPSYLAAWLQTDRMVTTLGRIGLKTTRSLAVRLGASTRAGSSDPSTPPGA